MSAPFLPETGVVDEFITAPDQYSPFAVIEGINYFVKGGGIYARSEAGVFSYWKGSGISGRVFVKMSDDLVVEFGGGAGPDYLHEIRLGAFSRTQRGPFVVDGYNLYPQCGMNIDGANLLCAGRDFFGNRKRLYSINTNTWATTYITASPEIDGNAVGIINNGRIHVVTQYSGLHVLNPDYSQNAYIEPTWYYSNYTIHGSFVSRSRIYLPFYAGNPSPYIGWWWRDVTSGDIGYYSASEFPAASSGTTIVDTSSGVGFYGSGTKYIRFTPATILFQAEAHETTHALALEWTEAADGTPVAYDDGAAYDYIESTITARMTPDELTALETAWQSSTKLYTITSTGYLLGPLIDMSAGVEVRLMSYQVDQSADSSMTLYDVTIGVHYGPLSAPSTGSLAVVQSRGRPYHLVAPGAASWITEGGTSDVNAYGRASERSCTWYTHSLTTAQAADVVNALRTLRGSSTTWTAGGVATPWGPGESGTATVWIPEWSVHRESNLLWGVQMELVRNG